MLVYPSGVDVSSSARLAEAVRAASTKAYVILDGTLLPSTESPPIARSTRANTRSTA